MGYAIPKTISLETVDCCNCGVTFAIPDYMLQRLRRDGGEFYCPNGHGQHFTRTEVAKLREMLEAANKKNTDLSDRLGKALSEKNKAQAANDRLMKRVKGGVCPCCNRTFQDLQRHMKTKHAGAKK